MSIEKASQRVLTCDEYRLITAKRRISTAETEAMSRHINDCRRCGHDKGVNHMIADAFGDDGDGKRRKP